MVRRDVRRVIAIAIAGAAVAPTCLAWGLSRAGATAGSLVLNVEAALTVLLACAIYREPLGRRVIVAVAVMAGAGALLVLDASSRGGGGMLGAIAVGAATLAWAIDNTLTRGLAERYPLQVIAAKGALGATLTTVLAFAWSEALPPTVSILALLACGATGYGLSLRLYLLAQRRIGAARTGSVRARAIRRRGRRVDARRPRRDDSHRARGHAVRRRGLPTRLRAARPCARPRADGPRARASS